MSTAEVDMASSFHEPGFSQNGSNDDETPAAGRQDHEIADQQQQAVVASVRLVASETGVPDLHLFLDVTDHIQGDVMTAPPSGCPF
jgi:hypothetical protein